MNERTGPIIVTGGSRGIGAATVARLVALGHPVLFGYRSDDAAADTSTGQLERTHALVPGRVVAVRCDLATEAGVLALFAAADEIAAAIVWLLSDAASYVTGTSLHVSGGR